MKIHLYIFSVSTNTHFDIYIVNTNIVAFY